MNLEEPRGSRGTLSRPPAPHSSQKFHPGGKTLQEVPVPPPGVVFQRRSAREKKEENVKIKTCKGGKSDPQGLGTPRSTPGSSWASWGRGPSKQHPRTPFPPFLAAFPLLCWCRVEKGNPKCDAPVHRGAQDGCSRWGAHFGVLRMGCPYQDAHFGVLTLGHLFWDFIGVLTLGVLTLRVPHWDTQTGGVPTGASPLGCSWGTRTPRHWPGSDPTTQPIPGSCPAPLHPHRGPAPQTPRPYSLKAGRETPAHVHQNISQSLLLLPSKPRGSAPCSASSSCCQLRASCLNKYLRGAGRRHRAPHGPHQQPRDARLGLPLLSVSALAKSKKLGGEIWVSAGGGNPSRALISSRLIVNILSPN